MCLEMFRYEHKHQSSGEVISACMGSCQNILHMLQDKKSNSEVKWGKQTFKICLNFRRDLYLSYLDRCNGLFSGSCPAPPHDVMEIG